MLPAANRMRTAADFAHTTRRGTKVSRGSVVVYVTTAPDQAAPRVGLVVSTSVGNSVLRHRVSRRIRGAVAPLLPTLPAGTRLVVRALPGSATDQALPRSIAEAVGAGVAREQGRSR
jgi:ribonuclease P protein component